MNLLWKIGQLEIERLVSVVAEEMFSQVDKKTRKTQAKALLLVGKAYREKAQQMLKDLGREGAAEELEKKMEAHFEKEMEKQPKKQDQLMLDNK